MVLRFAIVDDNKILLDGDEEGYQALRDALDSKLKLKGQMHCTLVCDDGNKVHISTAIPKKVKDIENVIEG